MPNTNFDNRKDSGSEDSVFVQRFSPYHFADQEVPEEDLRTIVGAGRWAPSSYNDQPWRLFTGSAAGKQPFVECLLEGNRKWAQHAPVLGLIVARKKFAFNDKENASAHFDCGSFWLALTLQANMLGYRTHGMAGYSAERASQLFDLNDDEEKPVCMFALGKQGEGDEVAKASARYPLEDFWNHQQQGD